MLTARILAVALMALIATQAAAQDKGKKKRNDRDKDRIDDVVGAIWHYKLTHGGKTETGNFRVHQFEIFRGKEKIGVVKPKDEDESSFRVSGYPELNGQATIHKDRDMPGFARGVLIRPNGEKWDIEIEIKDK